MCSDGLVQCPMKESICHENSRGKMINLEQRAKLHYRNPHLREAHIVVSPVSGYVECRISMIFLLLETLLVFYTRFEMLFICDQYVLRRI